jgi:hypothetical protein
LRSAPQPLTELDSKALTSFADNDVSDFIAELGHIRQTGKNGVRSLNDILSGRTTPQTVGENQTLAIGRMATDDTVNGQSLIQKVQDGAKAIDGVFVAQKTLFGDIHTELHNTIKAMLKKQDVNLDAIGGQQMLDLFSDVDSDLSGSSASGSTSSAGS